MAEEKKYAAKCPHCETRLRVRRQDLGSNRTCPKCKQVFAIPNPAAAKTRATSARSDELSPAGSKAAEDWTPPVQIAVVCGTCKTRYYAAENQVGQTLPCPDCHVENHVTAPKPDRPVGLQPMDASKRGLGFEPGFPARNAEQFRVTCRVCESVLYCQPKHVGKKIRCSDCGTILTVPNAPPKKAKSTLQLEDPGINVRPEAAVPAVKSNADQLLKKAAKKYHEVEATKQKPPERPWRDKLWTLPFQLEVLPLFLAISLLACFAVFLAATALESGDGLESLFGMAIMAAAGVMAILLTLVATNTFMGVAVASSMGHTEIDFPKFEMFGYVMTAILVINAIAVTYGPGVSIGFIVGIPWVSLIALPIAFIGFPIVFLSMLDASSAAVPFTKYIGSTLKQNRPEWIRFYLIASLVFILSTIPHGVGVVLVLLGQAVSTELRAGLFIGAVVTSTYGALVYFCLIGRLVWVIDQSGKSTKDDEPDREAKESPARASA